MHKRTKQLILACAVPILILLGMTVTPLYTLYKGEEITLQTVPVDPSDLFRGDHVILKYEAEEVPKELVDQNVITEMETGRGELKVYVLLEKKNGVHSPVKVTLHKPYKGIFLKGKMHYISQNMNQKNVAFIEYSLDKYFVEDNTGLEWEKASAKGEVVAKVKVNNGYAYIVDIEKKE